MFSLLEANNPIGKQILDLTYIEFTGETPLLDMTDGRPPILVTRDMIS
jgi:hypothetical protein